MCQLSFWCAPGAQLQTCGGAPSSAAYSVGMCRVNSFKLSSLPPPPVAVRTWNGGFDLFPGIVIKSHVLEYVFIVLNLRISGY